MLEALKRSWRNNVSAWIFLAPAMILTSLFFVYPLFRVLQMSLYKWAVIGTNRFIGWANYDRLLHDPLFWESLKNTVIYTVVVTPMIFLPALVLALVLNNSWKGTTFFRAVYFLPVAISFVVASLVWLWMYNEMYGILNYVLMSLGLTAKRVAWLGSTWMARLSVSVMIAWKTAGFSMVILLAGLQGIPQYIYEAASIDGATPFKRLCYVTFPLLRPTFVLALLVSLIGSFLAFDHFYVMTQGGPANTTMTIVMYIFRTGFEYFNLGYGAAMSIALLIILIVLSVIQIRFMNNDHRE